MVTSDDFAIRRMTPGEVKLAIGWAADEGWNPGLDDAACFRAADPDGFLVGLLDGDPIASISVVRYGASFGFLGLYIVRPDRRGQGYGMRIWQAGMAYLAGRTVGLDSVVAQAGNYRKSGFEAAHSNMRYEGVARGGGAAHPGLVELGAVPFETVAAYDRAAFPAERRAFLAAWLGQPRGAALGIVQGAALAGYGVIRPCRTGYKLGPLFAETSELADALFSGLTARVQRGAPVYLDAPQPNAAAVALAERRGMRVVFTTARMYLGPVPRLPLDRVFGVTSFELG